MGTFEKPPFGNPFAYKAYLHAYGEFCKGMEKIRIARLVEKAEKKKEKK